MLTAPRLLCPREEWAAVPAGHLWIPVPNDEEGAPSWPHVGRQASGPKAAIAGLSGFGSEVKAPAAGGPHQGSLDLAGL